MNMKETTDFYPKKGDKNVDSSIINPPCLTPATMLKVETFTHTGAELSSDTSEISGISVKEEIEDEFMVPMKSRNFVIKEEAIDAEEIWQDPLKSESTSPLSMHIENEESYKVYEYDSKMKEFSKDMCWPTYMQSNASSCSVILPPSSTEFTSVDDMEIIQQKHIPKISRSSESRTVPPEQSQGKKSFASCSTADDEVGKERACFRYLPEVQGKEIRRCDTGDGEISANYDGIHLQRETLGSTSLKRVCEGDERERKEGTLECYTDKNNLAPKHTSKKEKCVQIEQWPFKCSQCGKALKNKNGLRRHMYIHTGERFICNQCGKDSKSKGDLIRHLRIHTGEKPFNCNQCGKSFTSIGNLTVHLRIHSDEKLFKCNQCGKSFKTSGNLINHMQCHSDERPFKCNRCVKAFRRSDGLKIHMKSHTGERPFKCIECEKMFKLPSHLSAHMRTHSGERLYKCSHCDKSFMHNNSLTKHTRSHSGEKPFKCNQCGKGFKRSDLLTPHMKTHTVETTFKCSK